MIMNKISESTPIAMMTVGQLKEFFNDLEPETREEPKNDTTYVYGIRGIQELFNVSHVTAIKYKNTIIKDAVMQQGRKIVVEKEKAMNLFKEWEGE